MTIADPRRPELLPDVIVHSSSARTSPRQRKALVAVVLAIALIGGAVAVFQNRAATQAAHRATLAAVRLAFGNGADLPEPEHGPDETVLVLRNDGPDRLEIKRFLVDDGTYLVVTAPTHLGAAELGQLVVRKTGRCPNVDDPLVPATMSVTLVVRGLTTVVRLPVTSFAAEALRSEERIRCGLPPLAGSMNVQSRTTVRVAGGVRIHAVLYAGGVRPLEVRRIQLAPGLRLVSGPHLPLLLPRQPDAHSVQRTINLDLVVAVTNCTQAQYSTGQDEPYSEDVWLTVAHPGSDETFVAHLSDLASTESDTIPLTDGCPPLTDGH